MADEPTIAPLDADQRAHSLRASKGTLVSQLAQSVNMEIFRTRPRCRAYLTRKRLFEERMAYLDSVGMKGLGSVGI